MSNEDRMARAMASYQGAMRAAQERSAARMAAIASAMPGDEGRAAREIATRESDALYKQDTDRAQALLKRHLAEVWK